MEKSLEEKKKDLIKDFKRVVILILTKSLETIEILIEKSEMENQTEDPIKKRILIDKKGMNQIHAFFL